MKLKKVKEIPVRELQIGSVLHGRGVKVSDIEPCTQPDYVHVNNKDCYWIYSIIAVLDNS